jgi:hypothetical protein
VISKFDEEMKNYALKYEILEYNKELKTFCKSDVFSSFKVNAEGKLTEHKKFMDDMM